MSDDQPIEIPGEVVIEKTDANALGIGSYGAVYKAKIGQLPCAAKILHPTLFHMGDPGSDRIRMLFERECRVLRHIRHPHVIQYIKSFQDEESKLPILLMELMDESLTHYLDHLNIPVPHHVKLNIAHDIALALEFLHSIGILHRDLSGNNVLLSSGKRAKVTDFGMAKMLDGNVRMTPATTCPGTVAYMPPEAFQIEPKYTQKLDCFSAGVVYLQILTRRFPDPRDRTHTVLNDERYPTGIEVRIPERERRHNDIAMVAPDDPLLHIALDCIHDEARMRPYASEICGRIEALKSTSWSEYVAEQERLEREGRAQRDPSSSSEVEEGESVNEAESQKIRDLESRLTDSEELLQVFQSECDKLQLELASRDREMNDLRKELAKTKKDHSEIVHNIKESIHEKHETLMTIRYELEQAEQQLTNKDLKISELEQKLEKYQILDIQQQHQEQQRTRLHIPVNNSLLPPKLDGRQRALSASDLPSMSNSSSERSPDLRWRSFGDARKIEGYSATVCDSIAYFTDGDSTIACNTVTGGWTTLPPCNKRAYAVCLVGGLLTAIGGYSEKEGGYSQSLLSLGGSGGGESHSLRVWQTMYPSMKHGRTNPATVTTGHLLVVAGGHGPGENGRSVELLDTSTMVWSTATSLPFSIWSASAVTCGNRLYIGGGVREGKPLGCHDVLYCSLSDLQVVSSPNSSSHRKLLGFKFLGSSSHKTWHTTAKLSKTRFSLVAFHGYLCAVGGQSSIHDAPVDDVHFYSPSSNEWSCTSHMTQPRSKCFVTIVPGNRLMVLGGMVGQHTKTESIEIAEF